MTTARRAAALAAGVLLLSGCGFRGAYSVSLPGGADVGDDPYRVEVEFLDVLDLVQQSAVRVADVPVGRVEKIELDDDWTARVTVLVNGDVDLPANAVAAIQQSSLLGEKYVELAPPGNAEPVGSLEEQPLIPLERTNRNVEVEELLGALSLVLNGGGLTQLQTISRELGDAMEGREDELKNTLDQLDVFIGGLDEQKAEISRALDSADRLATTLAARTTTIQTALDTIGPGLDVINQQRDLLVSMLDSLARLGDVGTRVINQSAQNTIADLQLLQPILSQLAAAGPNLAGSLELLLTYPFPDSSLSALNYREAQSGGYALFTNMTATLNFDLSELLCRYAIDPISGALKISTQVLAGNACGQPGTAPGNQAAQAGSQPQARSAVPQQGAPFSLPTLPDVVGQIPGADQVIGRLGLPPIPGVTQ